MCDDCDTPKSWLTISLRFLIFLIWKKSWKFTEECKNESFLLIFSWIRHLLSKQFLYYVESKPPYLNGPERYLERVRKAYQKFSRSTWKKGFTSKHEVLSEYSDLTLSFIFQNLNFSRFSWHIIWLVCRTVTIFVLLTQRSRLSRLPRHFEHFRKAYKKISRGTWKKSFSSKHEVLSEYFNLVSSFIFHFLSWNFFQESLENVL